MARKIATHMRKFIVSALLAAGGLLTVVLANGFSAMSQQIELPSQKIEGRLMAASFEEIKAQEDLFKYALNLGGAAFARNCTRCHGSQGRGNPGIPALNDKNWLWGGDFNSIYWTIQHGVRGEDGLTRVGSMPEFSASNILTETQAEELAEFVLSLKDGGDLKPEAEENFKALCSRCHGPFGGGLRAYGAPSLVDDYWLYGGEVEDIKNQILHSQHGVMPAWEGKLPPEAIKALAVYVHSLGGGTN